jgi:hypothetical protein
MVGNTSHTLSQLFLRELSIFCMTTGVGPSKLVLVFSRLYLIQLFPLLFFSLSSFTIINLNYKHKYMLSYVSPPGKSAKLGLVLILILLLRGMCLFLKGLSHMTEAAGSHFRELMFKSQCEERQSTIKYSNNISYLFNIHHFPHFVHLPLPSCHLLYLLPLYFSSSFSLSIFSCSVCLTSWIVNIMTAKTI